MIDLKEMHWDRWFADDGKHLWKIPYTSQGGIQAVMLISDAMERSDGNRLQAATVGDLIGNGCSKPIHSIAIRLINDVPRKVVVVGEANQADFEFKCDPESELNRFDMTCTTNKLFNKTDAGRFGEIPIQISRTSINADQDLLIKGTIKIFEFDPITESISMQSEYQQYSLNYPKN